MWNAPIIVQDTLRDFEYPQREAAFFYGLFLRGHSADCPALDKFAPD
jgi:hypothetical protein